MSWKRLVVLALIVVLWQDPIFGQSVLNVPTPSYPTIQSAVNAAASGDTILVGPGTYFENVVVSGPSMQIVGAGPGLSIIDGGGVASCVKVSGLTAMVYQVEGFTLQNGRGEIVYPGLPLRGGGILCTGQMGAAEQIFKNCEITSCTGSRGVAICASLTWRTIIENVEIHGCSGGVSPGSNPFSVVMNEGGASLLSLAGCRLHNNSADSIVYSDGHLRTADCQLEFNSTTTGVMVATDGAHSVRRTKIVANVVAGANSSVASFSGSVVDFGECLIAHNVGGLAVVACSAPGASADLSNSTIAGNQLSANPLGVILTDATIGIVNMVVWGNVDPVGLSASAVYSSPMMPVGLARDSILENGTALGTSVLSVDPLFIDAPNGDYRLIPTSPAIDLGTTSLSTVFYPSMPATDLDGEPRVKGGSVDLGCFESQSIASSPAASGRVGVNAGGPFDVLTINGSAGGDFRTVTVPVGTGSVVAMLQPPNVMGPVPFSIFGLLGRAELEYVHPVPLGIGDMCFAPAPLFPSYQPILFTYASTIGPLNGVVPLLPALPTPWSSGVGPGIPFPLTLSFQGVIEESPGVFVPTNVIVFEVN